MDNEELLKLILQLDGYGLIITDEDLLRETLELPPEKEVDEEVLDYLYSPHDKGTDNHSSGNSDDLTSRNMPD
jgi:hypothetical protein